MTFSAKIRAAIGMVSIVAATREGLAAGPDFRREIEPILAKHCHTCHGPDKQKSGLRLDHKDRALRGGDSGVLLVPGKSAESLLFEHISGVDPDSIMPPEDANDPLTSAEIALLKAWIDAGAVWPDDQDTDAARSSSHWAFRPPARPEIPSPVDATWSRTPVDRFVLARLEQQKLKPAAEADRATLLRRLHFDILGLPPTPADLKAFVADRSPDAYERLVDRLLASPHFGERWGRHWLDLARYADSDGYSGDYPRPYAYLYRDWVIDAINRDLPFDQFTIEQLAGDLLPGATHKQRIATGFHRQSATNREGGVDREEFRNKAVVDRVDTTGAVWQALTLGCAECHTHKYDPITQREFFALFAFFNNADDTDLPSVSAAETGKFQKAKSDWGEKRAPLQAAFDAYVRDGMPAKLLDWEKSGMLALPVWRLLVPENAASAEGATLKIDPDSSVRATGKNPESDSYTVEVAVEAGEFSGVRLEALLGEGSKPAVGRSRGGNFVLTEFGVKLRRVGEETAHPIVLRNPLADFSQTELSIAAAIDGRQDTGWAVSPEQRNRHVATFEFAEPLRLQSGDRLVFTLEHRLEVQHTFSRFRLALTHSAPPLAASLTDDLVAIAWGTPVLGRTEEHRKALADYFRDEIDFEAKGLRAKVDDMVKTEPKAPETKAAVMSERATPRATHVHVRGDFLRKGAEVTPGIPAVFGRFDPRSVKPDRLDLARWLVSSENPLTSRVAVNHIWKHLFGRGIVPSANDFGTRGELPTHPELLDWLATEFPRLGWSRKALIRMLVTSATYRQSSDGRPELQEMDPLNSLWARQNRLRLEAEVVRDAHLAVGGLLRRTVGGASVRVPGVGGAAENDNSREARAGIVLDAYRRSMYTYFQRTRPDAMMMTFDAPDASSACTRRERSNTPLQALTLWNDPAFYDCARALGATLMAESSVHARLRRAFEVCLARSPEEAELARLRRLYDDQVRLIRDAPANAKLIVGKEHLPVSEEAQLEQAGLVAVVRTIMNLDEFITRG